MNIEILPSSPDHPREKQVLTSFLVNGVVAVDAGALGLFGEARDQGRVHDIFLTHSHADHIASLPIFVENAHCAGATYVTIHGSEPTVASLREHVFNGRIWPDYLRLAEEHGEAPCLRFRVLEPGETVHVEDLAITPIPVDHVVPTFGYLIDDGTSIVAFGGDSGPTEDLWRIGRDSGRLRAAFLEASFPDALADLARRTGHLTPQLLAAETSKIPSETEVVAVHIRPRYRERVVTELFDRDLPHLGIGRPEHGYRFE